MKELQKMMGRWGVCSYVSRAEALTDRDSKFVKTRWVLTEKGIDVRSRFVVSVCQGGSAGGSDGRHSAAVCGEVTQQVVQTSL